MTPLFDNATSARQRNVRLWLLVLWLTMLLSASLYPFDFSTADFIARARALRFGPGVFGYAGRGDIVGNLLAYIPFGLLMVLLLAKRPAWLRLALAVAAGATLSLVIEVLQLGIRMRYTTPGDFLSNTLSTTVGALAALWYERRTPRGTIARLQGSLRGPIVPLLLTIWVAVQSAPFLPRLRILRIIDSLSDFATADWFDGTVLRHGATLLLLSALLRAFTRREWFWPVFAAAVLGSWMAALLFVQHSLSMAQILAAVMVMPLVIWLRDKPYLIANALLVWIVGALLLLSSLTPVVWSFESVQVSLFDLSGDYAGILEKVLLVIGTLWLGSSSRLGLVRAALFLAALMAVTTLVNWLLWREPRFEGTDWLLLVFGWLLLHAARGVDWTERAR